MSNNPFDALGGGPGGLDLGALLQQAQQMQEDMMAAQQRLAAATVEGTVAGGAVTVTVNGSGELTGVSIRPEAVDRPDDALEGGLEDALEDLGDLIVAAYRDARAQIDKLAEETLGPLAGGMPEMPDIPGMPGLPGSGNPGQLGF
ncbi:YbaB/EbfC family nucleoid-associated protein [Nocardioides sp. GY 10113]|uniref:YbaB/EbfC family nucleoid-associated protein n=1 Tax=Nocardioides sp. GY 10113 TaxID=2569761 RepID=UPI0010A75F40|nr:YbaB/EbfC family nucleoid-associated protein [Nocardioides sp. GY 10113]TIC89173.1 YbaB/EbfC family nucleoid-associated protein [Nocardioides sp. GY 10113]